MNIQINNGRSVAVSQSNKKVIIDGVSYDFPKGMTGSYMSTINGNVYIDGFEFKNGKWKRTLRALWHIFF